MMEDKDYRKDQPIRIFINNFLMLIFFIIPFIGTFATLPFVYADCCNFMKEVFGFFGAYLFFGWISGFFIAGFWRYVIINDWYLPENKQDSLWL